LQLFAAIGQRQTHRGAFLVRQLPHGLLAALKIAAEAEGAWLMHVERAASRVSLADLVAEGDRAQCSDHLFRRELSSWLRPNASPLGDGLPGYTLGFGGFMSRVAPRLVRTFDVGPRQARIDRKLVLDAPALLLLGTDRDDQGHWLAAGQALGHVLLRAAAEGVSAGFMNQPVQCPALRDRLNATLGRPGFAQIVMRLGHAQLGKPCWRRPVQDVVD
jgi:hypothetical protein